VRRFAWPLILVLPFGCTDLSGYGTEVGEAYVGDVIGNEGDGGCAPGTDCSFIRRGFAVGTTLRMSYDPDQGSPEAGRLTTSGEPCEGIIGPTFADEPMRVVVPLAHDSLSLYEFPGSGRIQNFIYAIQPTTGPLAGRDPIAFVSLLRGGDVEVRILAGSGQVICPPDDCLALASGTCDYFGIFRMKRQDVP
jgi:hypothetical protein